MTREQQMIDAYRKAKFRLFLRRRLDRFLAERAVIDEEGGTDFDTALLDHAILSGLGDCDRAGDGRWARWRLREGGRRP